jgi:hypothetical protein
LWRQLAPQRFFVGPDAREEGAIAGSAMDVQYLSSLAR